MKRKIKRIILHCSDSDFPQHDNAKTIDQWHRERGFDSIGYHFFIRKFEGLIEIGRLIEQIGAHCSHNNLDSIGICLSGRDQFTKEQFVSCRLLLQNLFDIFNLNYTNVYLHNQLDRKGKTCPNFTMKDLLGE